MEGRSLRGLPNLSFKKASNIVARPLTWQGTKLTWQRPKSQPAGRKTSSSRLRQLRLLHIFQGGASSTLATSSSLGSRRNLAANVVWQLRCIQLSSLRMQRNLDHHMNWIRVELGTLPGVVLTRVEQLVGDMQNMMRLLLSLMFVFFLLR